METKGYIRIEKFDYYNFKYFISSNGIRAITATILPYQNHFGYFYSLFNSIDKIEYILSQYQKLETIKELIIPGDNEWYITLEKSYTTFVVTLPEHIPIQVATSCLIDFLKNFKDWIIKLDTCQLPGIIPESKLDSWSCVPNEYIKDEWWEKEKLENKENGT